MIRNRVVQHIFSRPLHITITNGNECRPRSELNPRLAKALSLPFYKFPEIKVIFAPDLNIEPCSRGSHRKIPWPETPNDEQHMRLRHHWICIDEQCENLGVRFRDAIGRLPIDTSSPHFTFSWDGSRGIDEANKTRKSPLWEFVSLSGTMMPWEWVDEYQWPLHSKRPAMTYDICLPDQVATEILSDAPSWEETMGRLTPQPTLHEPRNAEELGEHTWPFHWADFWWHRSCDSAWFMCYHKIPDSTAATLSLSRRLRNWETLTVDMSTPRDAKILVERWSSPHTYGGH